MSGQPDTTGTTFRKQIISKIIRELKSLGLEILSEPRHIPWGFQIHVSSVRGEEKNQPSHTALINIYFGKNGITINLQGKNTDKLKKLIQPLIIKFSSLYGSAPRFDGNPDTAKFIYPIIGADEAGKGDYFGPLVVAAFLSDNAAIDRRLIELGVRDSKKISNNRCVETARQIKKIFQRSQSGSAKFSVMTITPEEYNNLYILEKNHGGNLNTLLKHLHIKNISNLIKSSSSCNEISVIIDDFLGEKNTLKNKNHSSLFTISDNQDYFADLSKNDNIKIQFIQKAEDKYPAVAAASIIARAEYLENLSRLSTIYLSPDTNKPAIQLTPGSGEKTSSLKQEIIATIGPDVLPHIAKTSFKIS